MNGRGTGALSWCCVIALAVLPFLLFWPVTLGRQVFADGDLFAYNFPLLHTVAEQWREGRVPLWNPYLFGGTPLLAQLQGGVFYPPNVLFLLERPEWLAYGHSILLHYALGGVFMFVYLRGLRLSRASALLGALVYMLGAFSMSHLGHVSTVRTLPWLPLILWSFDGWRLEASVQRLVTGAVALGLMLVAGHPQIPLYALMIFTSYGACFALTSEPAERRRALIGIPAILVLGSLVAAVQLLPSTLAASEYRRPDNLSYAYFSHFSLPPTRLANIFFPLLFPSNLAEETGYVGVVPLILAALAAVTAWRTTPFVRYLVAVAAAGLVLALGSNTLIYPLLYHVPFYNLFTVPARNFFEFSFAAAVLAAIGLERLLHAETARSAARPLRWVLGAAVLAAAGAVAVFALATWLDTATLLSFTELLDLPAVKNHLPIWGTAVVLLGGAAIWPRLAGRLAFSATLLAFVVFDLFRFGGSIYGRDEPSAYTARPASLDFLRQEREPFRTLTLEEAADRSTMKEAVAPDYSAAVGIESLNGFDSLMLRQVHEASGHVMPTYGLVAGEYARGLPQFERFMDLLNTRFVLVPAGQPQLHKPARYQPIFRNEQVVLYENLQALPRFFVAPDLKPVSAVEALRAMETGEVDGRPFALKRLALVEASADELAAAAMLPVTRRPSSPDSPAAVDILKSAPGDVEVRVDAATGGVLVHGSNYSAGWSATVDGLDVPVFRVDGVAQGVPLGPGAHRVRLAYRPRSVLWGGLLSLASLVGIVAVWCRAARGAASVRPSQDARCA